jgi:galactose mutarotase-like enzyme
MDKLAQMKALTNNVAVRREQGFDVYVLSNERVELAVVPELGARIISLKDIRTGREWLWHPPGGRRLFRNQLGDDFSTSPLVGVDECLPTIAPCSWQGRELPDHGEVWAAPWIVDADAWDNGVLQTNVRLEISPFDFERTVELQENEIRFSYQLRNRSGNEERFSWAMHPLLRLQSGDQLELPVSTRALLNGASWVEDLMAARPAGDCVKVFATAITEGFAAIHNPATEERLEFVWSPAENNTLGVWLTRGGWHGHEHFALEPTNSDADTLTVAAQRERCGLVAAGDTVTWQVCLRIAP